MKSIPSIYRGYMDNDLYLSIILLVKDHYIDSCFEIPLYVKININDFDIDEFNASEIDILENPFSFIELKSFKEESLLPYSNDIVIAMVSHPIFKAEKVFEA